MNVDGSAVMQTYKIVSNIDYDIHIMELVFYVQDSVVTHSGFGALGALTNGVNCKVYESGTVTPVLTDVKRFADFIVQTAMDKPFGDGTNAFELEGVYGSADAWCLTFPLYKYVPNGIRIGNGTLEKIEIEIRDDLTGLSEFNCRALGYRHYSRDDI